MNEERENGLKWRRTPSFERTQMSAVVAGIRRRKAEAEWAAELAFRDQCKTNLSAMADRIVAECREGLSTN